MSESSAPCTCPQGHDDTVRLLSTISVGGRASSARGRSGQPSAGGGGCCGGACGCGWPGSPQTPLRQLSSLTTNSMPRRAACWVGQPPAIALARRGHRQYRACPTWKRSHGDG